MTFHFPQNICPEAGGGVDWADGQSKGSTEEDRGYGSLLFPSLGIGKSRFCLYE